MHVISDITSHAHSGTALGNEVPDPAINQLPLLPLPTTHEISVLYFIVLDVAFNFQNGLQVGQL